MKWNGDISKIAPKPGEVIIIEGCTPEMFRDSEAIRAMFPDNFVLLLSPAQSISALDERMMKRLGWVRDKEREPKEKKIPCRMAPACERMFPSNAAESAHYRGSHTTEGRQRIANMHAARKKK